MDPFASLTREWPLGARGQLPARIVPPAKLTYEELKEYGRLPGVAFKNGALHTTWDMAPHVASLLGVPCPPLPLRTKDQLAEAVNSLPGIDGFRGSSFLPKMRPYQVDGALFLALRSGAINADPPRSGKSLQALGASVAAGARKTLIICPAVARMVWAAEVRKWLDEEAILLEGLSGTSARQYCRVCDGRGSTSTHARCRGCRLKNGHSNGLKILEAGDPERDLHKAIESAKFVIVNYELLQPHASTDAQGGIYYKPELDGWAPFLAQIPFDVCIADESHMLRGISRNAKKRGKTRRERFNMAVQSIPQVWGLTGTPIYGYVRDLWGQLDALTLGAFTGPGRLFFDFTTFFCEGHKGEYGWVDAGSANEDILTERLKWVMVQRSRTKILAQMPPKVRIVERVEQDPGAMKSMLTKTQPKSEDKREHKLKRLLSQTAKIKRPKVLENVIDQMAAGDKVIVFNLTRKNCDEFAKDLGRKLKSKAHSTRMRAVEAKMFTAHGGTGSAVRFQMARSFREHDGAACFVTTIDAMQVAVSLKGALHVHFADMHWSPAAMVQAEDRPYEVGVTGLNIHYYVVNGSIDEHIEETVLPKFKAQERVLEDESAQQVGKAFAGPALAMDEIFKKIEAAAEAKHREEERMRKLLEDED